MPKETRNQIFERWHRAGFPPLRRFASYAAFSQQVYMLFATCLAQGLVGTKGTNRVDLEYLLYLPFFQVFSSGDSLHKALAPVLLRADQFFVERDVLKADLRKLAAQWQAMSEYDSRRRLARLKLLLPCRSRIRSTSRG